MFRKSLNIVTGACETLCEMELYEQFKQSAQALELLHERKMWNADIVIKKGASAFDAEALFLFSGKLFTGLENSVTRRRNYALIIVV